MYEINKDFDKVRDLFSLNNKRFVFESIIEGNTPGKIYVNDIDNPEVYVVFDGGNFVLYIGGESKNQQEYTQCVNYIRECILTEKLREEFSQWITIAYTPNTWKKVLLDGLSGLIIEQHKRVLYRYNIENMKDNMYSNSFFQAQAINHEILHNNNLENIEELKDEINGMWGNIENFIKDGFGYCCICGEKLISWCTGEFFSENSCGIGIFTVEEERGKGVAGAVATRFIQECDKRSITPYWDSWMDNLSSIKVAEKIKFDKVEDYEVLGVKF